VWLELEFFVRISYTSDKAERRRKLHRMSSKASINTMSAPTRASTTRITPLATSTRNATLTASLWDTANAKLDPKTRKSLANVNIGKGRVVDAVLKEAVTQQKALAAKRWKVTIGGKEVVLRDVLAKIVR
jgi:hypothetical protein